MRNLVGADAVGGERCTREGRARAARVGLGLAAHLSELVARALVGLEVLLQHDLPVGRGADAHEGPEDPDGDVEGEEEGGVVAREPPRNVQAHAREARAAKGEAVSLEVLAAATERVRRGRRRVRAAGSGGGVGRCAVQVGVVEGGRIGGPPNRESECVGWGGVEAGRLGGVGTLRSNILLELKRDMGMAESALTRPESSSEVRNHELVSIGTEVSNALVIWAVEGAGSGAGEDSGGVARPEAAARSERKAQGAFRAQRARPVAYF